MDYIDALKALHRILRPLSYVEIGCRKGLSLSLAKCPSLAIDPKFEIEHQLEMPTRIFKQTSNDFFATHNLTSLIGGCFDLAFIDGMHRAEFVLQDFINLEKHAGPGSVIVIDDVLPQDMSWTTRERHTDMWTGDVYKIIPFLRKTRHDLTIEVFDIDMKGLAIISNLSPQNPVLEVKIDQYKEFLASQASELASIKKIRKALKPRPTDEFDTYVSGLSANIRPVLKTENNPAKKAYLDLMKSNLLNEIYLDDELRLLYLRDCLSGEQNFNYSIYHDIRSAKRQYYKLLQSTREIGRFPERNINKMGFSHTMMGRKRLDSLHRCLDIVNQNQVPGDLMECGVWRGGACIMMAAYLKAYELTDRKVLVADSFAGLPKPTMAEDEGLDLSNFKQLAISLETVKENFSLYGLLNDNIIFLKGWFKDTLKDAPVEQLALLRLDGDLYESTMDAMTALYDKVVTGGVVIIDDYGCIPACRRAIKDFFDSRDEELPEIIKIDWTGVYWIK